jgi:hypothetical protein
MSIPFCDALGGGSGIGGEEKDKQKKLHYIFGNLVSFQVDLPKTFLCPLSFFQAGR